MDNITHYAPEEVVEKLDGALGKGQWKIVLSREQEKYRIYLQSADDETIYALGSLVPFPGCCGLVVSCHAHVNHPNGRKGIGTAMNKFRMVYARYLGYGVVIATDQVVNTAQRKILAKNGWKDVYEFTNPRTHNRVAVSVVQVKEG